MKKVVGLGEILWDCLPAGKVLGGAPANFAWHASQFGLEGIAVSAVGKDDWGQEILINLAAMKSKNFSQLLEKVDFPTGTVQVTLDEQGIPRYEICENVAWDNIPFTPSARELAKNCSAVCFGSLAQRSEVSRTAISTFLELVPDSALKIFDVNLRQHFYTREIILDSLSKSNVLKINDEELPVVTKLLDCETLSETAACQKILKDYNLLMLIETKGAAGSYAVTANEISYIDTPRVRVADTVGAGDSFTGAFVAAILNGEKIRDAHRLAVEVSAYVCTQHGAMPQLPCRFVEHFNNR